MGVAVDGAGLAVRGPAGVSQAEVRVQLLIQVERILLCVGASGGGRGGQRLGQSISSLKQLHLALPASAGVTVR